MPEEISENIGICFWSPPITEDFLFWSKHTSFREGVEAVHFL